MAKSLVLTPQAEKDFVEAYDWYENQNLGLGKEFARCVDKKIASILPLPVITKLFIRI